MTLRSLSSERTINLPTGLIKPCLGGGLFGFLFTLTSAAGDFVAADEDADGEALVVVRTDFRERLV